MSFYVTTPIYYVNAAPHLGHAYTTVAADVLARHHRQRGEDVFFLTGTDEHGEPVADAAHALGIEPQELADRNALRFRQLAPLLGASNDFFIRTTDPQHEATVREVLASVRDHGYVYDGVYEGWYCPRCADFKSEGDIDPGNRCPIHHTPLQREQEENYFFALSAFQERLEALYAQRQDFVLPRTRYNEALSFIRSGLRDVPLTRRRLSWGVGVPWDSQHVFYVWFDALLNYYSALTYAPAPAPPGPGERRPGDGQQAPARRGAPAARGLARPAGASPQDAPGLVELFWPPAYHLIAKDILRFHAVYWPALLMAAQLELPRRIFVHGYLLMEGEKMSKSLGNVLDPLAVIERFGADALRFYLLREVPFGQDGSVSTISFELRYERELANELGNLASRALGLAQRYRDGLVPRVETDPALARELAPLPSKVAALMDDAHLTTALDAIWQGVRRLNRYVEEQAPWQLAKDPSQAAALDRVLCTLVTGLRVVAVLLAPFLPASMDKLLDALRAHDRSLHGASWDDTQGVGVQLARLPVLFPKEVAPGAREVP